MDHLDNLQRNHIDHVDDLQIDRLDHLDHLAPKLPIRYALQDLYSTAPTRETCGRIM